MWERHIHVDANTEIKDKRRRTDRNTLTMKKIITVIIIGTIVTLALPLLLLFKKLTWYELRDDKKITSEIPTVHCYVNENELEIEIWECDWFERDLCVNGQKVVEGTLHVVPVLKETKDTLTFVEKKNGDFIFKCHRPNSDCWTDELNINVDYKYDSLNNIYDRHLRLTLVKRWRLAFSVH
jgi:hypothetical protein